jgi:hypothetical protein
MSRNAEGSHTSKPALTADKELELSKIDTSKKAHHIDPEKRLKPVIFTAVLDNEVIKEDELLADFDRDHTEAEKFFDSDEEFAKGFYYTRKEKAFECH